MQNMLFASSCQIILGGEEDSQAHAIQPAWDKNTNSIHHRGPVQQLFRCAGGGPVRPVKSIKLIEGYIQILEPTNRLVSTAESVLSTSDFVSSCRKPEVRPAGPLRWLSELYALSKLSSDTLRNVDLTKIMIETHMFTVFESQHVARKQHITDCQSSSSELLGCSSSEKM
jgi:hypothetical protein